ncbi:inactive ribonuclease-like protein 10 [Antechinus flavipes]|uniref:inactive ribonuclease-like protein 10 n=1 Tax=Antechinus flavipes TaxID=38775 RepID=UPI0022367AD8|nr:inactive ribonuclease-like protein 10 [Antechinus flavipes]
MKAVLQVFPMLLLLLGLGWGYRLDPAILEDSQELLNQFWDSDSWEDAAEDMDIIQAMGSQEAYDNDMLLLDSTESALAEAFLREDEVRDEEEPAAEDLFREEVTSYLRQVQSNGDNSVMMVWKAWEPEDTCKAKRTVIHQKQEKGKAIHGTYEKNKCSRRRQPLLTICQVTEDIVSPKKYNHKSPLVTVTITIACDGLGPLSFNC